MNDYKFPTLEEFTDMILEDSKTATPEDWENGLKEYLQGDKARELIRGRYKRAKRQYDAGELPQEVLEVGVVSSAANCLDLMF